MEKNKMLRAVKTENLEIVNKILSEAENGQVSYSLIVYDMLSAASHFNKIDIVNLILSMRYHVDGLDSSRRTSLFRACKSRLSEPRLVQFLLEKGANVNKTVNGDWSPLATACYYNKLDLVQILIKHGASTAQKNSQGFTPLSIAVYKKHTRMCSLLLQHGALVDDSAEFGFSPLMFSAQYGLEDIADLLLRAGANVNKKNDQGFTPLMLAAENGHAQLVQNFLLHDEICIDACNNKGFNALLIAAYKGHLEVFKMILSHKGKDIPSLMTGVSSLMLAVKGDHTQIVKYLLSENASPVNHEDRQGVTALHLSLQNENVEMRNLLSKAGAVMDQSSASGATFSSVPEMEKSPSATTNIVEKCEKFETFESSSIQAAGCGGLQQGKITTSHERKRKDEERIEIKSTMTERPAPSAARVLPTHSAVARPCLRSDAYSSCFTKTPRTVPTNPVATASSDLPPVSNISQQIVTLARGMSEGQTQSVGHSVTITHSLSSPADMNAVFTDFVKNLPPGQQLSMHYTYNHNDQRTYNINDAETVGMGPVTINQGGGNNPKQPNDNSDEDNIE